MANKTREQREAEALAERELEEAKTTAKKASETKTKEDAKQAEQPPTEATKVLTEATEKREAEVLNQLPHLEEKRAVRQRQIEVQDKMHRNNFSQESAGGTFGVSPKQSHKTDVTAQADPTGDRFTSNEETGRFNSAQSKLGLPGFENQSNEPEDAELLDEPLLPRDVAALMQASSLSPMDEIHKVVRVIGKNTVDLPDTTVRVPVTTEVKVNA